MDATRAMVEQELDRLDQTLGWTVKSDQRAAYFIGCRFLVGLTLDAELSAFVAKRMGEIRVKYGVL